MSGPAAHNPAPGNPPAAGPAAPHGSGLKLVTWNVNGLRAAVRAGLPDFLRSEQPDILCLQEVKATPQDVDPGLFSGYHVHWNCAVKKGYSGVLIASRQPAHEVRCGMDDPQHDSEGRLVTAEYPDFFLCNVYVPNAQRGLTRLDYRLQWDAAFLRHLRRLDERKPVIFCGDLNVAHTEIDLTNPQANRRNAGFSEEERASFSRLLDAGFADVFRAFHPGEPGHHTWWTWRSNARERNIGWRIDYWVVSRRLLPRARAVRILKDVRGSDHCPVLLELNPS